MNATAVSSEPDPLQNTCTQRHKVHFTQFCAPLDRHGSWVTRQSVHMPQVSSTRAQTVVGQLRTAMATIMTPDCLPSTKDRGALPYPWVIPSDGSVLMSWPVVLWGVSRF